MHPLPWRNNLQSLAKQFTTLGETILNLWKDVEKMIGMQMWGEDFRAVCRNKNRIAARKSSPYFMAVC